MWCGADEERNGKADLTGMTSRPIPSPGMSPMWRERDARVAILGSCTLCAAMGEKELNMDADLLTRREYRKGKGML